MAYIGIDFHKNNTYVTRMDEKGNIMESKNLKNEKDILKVRNMGTTPRFYNRFH